MINKLFIIILFQCLNLKIEEIHSPHIAKVIEAGYVTYNKVNSKTGKEIKKQNKNKINRYTGCFKSSFRYFIGLYFSNYYNQEPMTRRLQLYCVRVTAFSQTDLFLN